MVFLISSQQTNGVDQGSANTLVHPNSFPTGVAVLGKHAVEAGEAVGPSLSHDVPLATQVSVAFKASKMLHVPSPTLGLGALVGEDDLKVGGVSAF